MTKASETLHQELPWWSSGLESALQCRGHEFDPWSEKSSHAIELLGPRATIREAMHHNEISHMP